MATFDVVIVGSGTAGSLTAKTIAKAGFNVCMIDQKPRTEIGDKVCGDAIGKHHFDDLSGILGSPKGDELENTIDAIELISPDKKTVFTVPGDGFIINRHLFGQRLVNEAIDAGATLIDEALVIEPITGNGWGVYIKNLKENKKQKLISSIIIDASGFRAVIRNKIKMFCNDIIQPTEVEVCYREIRDLKSGLEDIQHCKIYLTSSFAPGGYYWIFPEGDLRVNSGLGVQMIPNHKNPKKLFQTHVLNNPLFENSTLVKGGGGVVPTRRPIYSLVDDGLVLVGDSACQVNPIHGGGIGPSMQAGVIAGNTVISALEKENTSKESLWDYNLEYMKGYGAKQAGLDLFRILLQLMDDQDLNYGMSHKIMTEEDILNASLGKEFKLRITDKIKRVFRGIRKLSLLNKLRKVAKEMKKIKSMYRNYPKSPEKLNDWISHMTNIYQNVYHICGID
ncbi:MAG: NAD(P)/FAD-dependent oxidoreductase [Candidatus Helarchaeota archaeon]|nr:NAD(P)/FAD-dependent oxidoreductase [Candidatus Helarchaeota archaeon]